MGYLSWTKAWSASDNGTIFTGTHLGTLQSDIAAVLNGGISDANIAAAAAILESKLAFNTSTGHDHDGSNSKTIASSTVISPHYRRGCFIRRTANDTLSVLPGALDIGGTIRKVATATTLTGSTAGDYITGTEPTSSTIYIYGYNNSGTLAFKMHTAAPNLSDTSDTVVEEPWRYLKNGSTYYRCVGAIYNDASQNFLAGSEVNFDASSFACGKLIGSAADQTVTTIWTPDYVRTHANTDGTPSAGDSPVPVYTNFKYLLDDHTVALLEGNTNDMNAAATDAAVKTITAQAAGTAGSFVIDGWTSTAPLYWFAFTKELG